MCCKHLLGVSIQPETGGDYAQISMQLQKHLLDEDPSAHYCTGVMITM